MSDTPRQRLLDAINGGRFRPGQVGWLAVEEIADRVWPVVESLCEEANAAGYQQCLEDDDA